MQCFHAGTYIPFQTHFVDLAPLHKEYKSVRCHMNIEEVPKDVYEGLYRAAQREYPKSSILKETHNVVRHFLDGCIATEMAAIYASVKGAGIHLGGGYHHATMNPDEANYFCLINDHAVYAAKNPKLDIAVLDFDFHLGGGSFKCSQQFKNLRVYDVHQPKGKLIKDWSEDLDHHYVDTGVTDSEAYARETSLAFGLAVSRKPDILFYNAGADAAVDPLSIDDLLKRDRFVFTMLYKFKIPVAITLGGGYDEKAYTYWREMLRLVKEIFYAKS